MKQEIDSFSVSLNKKHFDAAIKIKDEMKEAGFEEPQIALNTMDVYKK